MKHSSMRCLAALTAFAVSVAGAAEAVRPGDKPLVVNGDLALTTLDFDAYMERVPAARRDEFRAEFEKINPTIDGLWIRRVLAARAKAAGMDKDPIVAARIRQAQEDILAQVYLTDVANKTKFPNLDARAREVYKANLKEFTKPELISGLHILVTAKQRTHEEAKARAQQVYERARAGEDFKKLADEMTDSAPTRDITDQPLSVFEKPLPDILAKLKPNEVMAPVETRYGFHIIKLTGRVPARVMPFEEVKDDIIEVEKQKITDDARTAAAEAARADPNTTLYVENVRALKSDFKVPEEAIRKSLNPEAAR
jgi:peptidyl-prolyl cis-trans isomerase C